MYFLLFIIYDDHGFMKTYVLLKFWEKYCQVVKHDSYRIPS